MKRRVGKVDNINSNARSARIKNWWFIERLLLKPQWVN